MINLWHDISRGNNAPHELNVIIEIPRGSNNKYEIDKETGLIALDRANYGAAAYPFDYGFVPQTLWHDNDPLDVVVFTTYPLHPGVLVKVRPVGVMKMIDDGDSDWKILGVPIEDRRWDDTQDLKDLNKHTLLEIKDFFENIKNLKGKKVIVTIEGFDDKHRAQEAIKTSIALYQEKFGK